MTARKQPVYKKARYMVETVLVYLVFYFFRVLPLDTASNLGGFIVGKIGCLLPSTKTARKNISLAFPEKTAEEQKVILKGMWNNLGRVIAEYAHLDDIWDRVELEGGEYLDSVRDSGKPAIFFAAHLANWEICPLATRKKGLETYAIYRSPNNPGVTSLLSKARGAGAAGLIPKGASGAKKMLSVLKRNGSLGILMDQKLNEGMAIPFFGIDAMTAPSIASFALKFKCPVHPVRIERTVGCKFKMTVYPALEISNSDNHEEDMRKILTEVNKHIEEWIRASPEQWLWVHKRWPREFYL